MPRKSIRNGNLGEKIGGKRTALEVLWADEDTRWGRLLNFVIGVYVFGPFMSQ